MADDKKTFTPGEIGESLMICTGMNSDGGCPSRIMIEEYEMHMIEEQAKRIKELNETARGIPVTERPPEAYAPVHREYIFRGFSVKKKEWVAGDLIQNYVESGDAYIVVDTKFPYNDYNRYIPFGAYEVDPNTVSQFTGKRIRQQLLFEGDIIRYGNALYVIEWNNVLSKYMCRPVDDNKWLIAFELINLSVAVDIVGNCFDNPELMEVPADV